MVVPRGRCNGAWVLKRRINEIALAQCGCWGPRAAARTVLHTNGSAHHFVSPRSFCVCPSQASQFKATVAHNIIRMLGGRRVLDPCAGWGDRLLGAMSCDDIIECYVGM